MNLAIVSTYGGRVNLNAMYSRLAAVRQESSYSVTMLKLDTAGELDVNADVSARQDVSVVQLSDWLNENKVNAFAVSHAAVTIPVSHWIVLDATLHSPETLSEILKVARTAWYRMDEWHSGFAIQCNEVDAYKFAQLLSDCFYLRPVFVDDFDLYKKLRHFMQAAYLTNLLGHKVFTLSRLKKLLMGT